MMATTPRFAVVVVAGPADGHLSDILDRQRALTAIAEAVVERGGQIVTTADADVAAHMATVTLAYVEGHTVEHASANAPIRVTETGGIDRFSRAALAPFLTLAALDYRDSEARAVPMEARFAETLPGEPRQHPLTATVTRGVDAQVVGAVVIAPSPSHMREAYDWHDSPLFMFAVRPDLQPSASNLDPTPRLLDLLEISSRDVVSGDLAFEFRSLPYGTMMELIVDEWLKQHGILPQQDSSNG
jgi:hypothetical protein